MTTQTVLLLATGATCLVGAALFVLHCVREALND